MKYGDFSMKKADTLFMSVVKHPVHYFGFNISKSHHNKHNNENESINQSAYGKIPNTSFYWEIRS